MNKDERWLLEEKYGNDVSAPGFAADRERLAAGEPLAYVIGWQPFLGLRIYLDSRPLIPRPETEWWTEQLLEKTRFEAKRSRMLGALGAGATWQFLSRSEAAKKFAPARVSAANGRASRCAPQHATARATSFLDLCAGSGVIGCAALAQLPHAQVYFGELDLAHKATIQKNIRENHLDETRADIRIGNLFAPFAGMRFNRIVANPPYIPCARTLPESVARYEPAGALYAGPDGLDLVRRIISELPHYLAPQGEAWIEIDASQATAVLHLAQNTGLSATILNDQYKMSRVLVLSSS